MRQGTLQKFSCRVLLPAALAASLLVGCKEDPSPPPPAHPVTTAKAPYQSASPSPRVKTPPLVEEPESKSPAPVRPKTLDAALQFLDSDGYADMADIIQTRVEQKQSKMKLSPSQGKKAATYLVNDLPQMPNTQKLSKQMPHSTVELVRAVHERGVSRQDAEGISDYLLRFIDSMRFGNLAQLDINHSHVIGREWDQIDYSGEPLDPQRQKANGQRRGIMDFKQAEYIRLYFRSVHRLPYFSRIYRPQGRLPEF